MAALILVNEDHDKRRDVGFSLVDWIEQGLDRSF
jgi:hypothetical protein